MCIAVKPVLGIPDPSSNSCGTIYIHKNTCHQLVAMGNNQRRVGGRWRGRGGGFLSVEEEGSGRGGRGTWGKEGGLKSDIALLKDQNGKAP